MILVVIKLYYVVRTGHGDKLTDLKTVMYRHVTVVRPWSAYSGTL